MNLAMYCLLVFQWMIWVHNQLIVTQASDIFDSYPSLKKIEANPLLKISLQGTVKKRETTSKDHPLLYHRLMSKH